MNDQANMPAKPSPAETAHLEITMLVNELFNVFGERVDKVCAALAEPCEGDEEGDGDGRAAKFAMIMLRLHHAKDVSRFHCMEPGLRVAERMHLQGRLSDEEFLKTSKMVREKMAEGVPQKPPIDALLEAMIPEELRP
jgi:hypothetical protein